METTFTSIKVSDPTRKVEIEIGDSKQSEFYPQFKTLHWDNECNFSLRLKDSDYSTGTFVDKTGMIEWANEGRIARMYNIPGFEDGGFEFEVELSAKPASNILEFTIQSKEFNFFYQPALTQKEIDDGAQQPENVIGSYAVYHASKRDNVVGQKEYRTGKAFHIYRPHAVDADKNETWCDLNIEGGLMTVTIPQSFLDTTTYPIRIDPTFGYTSIGATGTTNSIDFASFVNGIPNVGNGVVQSIQAYGRDPSGTTDLKAVLWLKSNNTIVTNGVGGTVTINSSIDQWWLMSYSIGPSVVAGITYQVGYVSNNTWSTYKDTGSSTVPPGQGFDANNFTTPTDLSSPYGNDTNIYSVYATYTDHRGFHNYPRYVSVGDGMSRNERAL